MFFPEYLAPKYAFSSVGEFLDHYREMLMLFCTEKYTESLLSRIPRDAAIKFTHGDLVPKNIMVKGSTVTGIIDWADGGFYPEYFEYCRMHDPNFMMPGWKSVLQAVFPGEPREIEINAVCELLHGILHTLG
jgi:thiamine kinase-like enzyme